MHVPVTALCRLRYHALLYPRSQSSWTVLDSFRPDHHISVKLLALHGAFRQCRDDLPSQLVNAPFRLQVLADCRTVADLSPYVCGPHTTAKSVVVWLRRCALGWRVFVQRNHGYNAE